MQLSRSYTWTSPAYKKVRVKFSFEYSGLGVGDERDVVLETQLLQRHNNNLCDTVLYLYRNGNEAIEDFNQVFNLVQCSGQWTLEFEFYVRNTSPYKLVIKDIRIYSVE